MFDTAFVLIVIAALLVVIGVCQPLAARLKLPPPVLLGVVGVALGGFPAVLSQLGWSAGSDPLAGIFAELPVSSETFIYVFLPLLVFEAGIVTDVRRTLEDAAPILLLAVVATLITTAVIGLALWPLAGVPPRPAEIAPGIRQPCIHWPDAYASVASRRRALASSPRPRHAIRAD